MKKTVSCGTATIRTGKHGLEVLLVQPHANRDTWGFPKGHQSANESYEETAARETLEETGFDVEIMPQLLGTAHLQFEEEAKTVIIYFAIPNDSEAKIEHDHENHKVAWWPLSKLPRPMQSQQELFANLHKLVDEIFKD